MGVLRNMALFVFAKLQIPEKGQGMDVVRVTEKAEVFSSEDGDRLEVRYDNRGEPYREGIKLAFRPVEDEWGGPTVFLEKDEARRLRDLIDRLYPR